MLTFDQVRRTQTVNVVILDDDVSDGVKEFSLQVLPVDMQLRSPLAESTVQILDNESKHLGVGSYECVCVCVCVCVLG